MIESETSILWHVADQIHRFLATRCVTDGALLGPDPGVRWNYRLWRFCKSYAPHVAWNDDYYYLQAQGYWILGNWNMSHTNDDYARQAVAASDQVTTRQRNDGSWDYPNPEWKGRVATVEGCWASLGLMESYRQSGFGKYLSSVLHWHAFLESEIGFQNFGRHIAVNYFAHQQGACVPNNSALVLRYLANLADVTGDQVFLNRCQGLLEFIDTAQLPSGEVPYIHDDPKRIHFQCFQYQAFLYLDLREYYLLTGDEQARHIMIRLLDFLKGGISPDGYVYYQCGQYYRTVNYHTCAVASALASGNVFAVADCDTLAEKAFRYVTGQQRKDGSLPHSRGDYRVLEDRRPYPRYLAMMMHQFSSVAGDAASRTGLEETRNAIS